MSKIITLRELENNNRIKYEENRMQENINNSAKDLTYPKKKNLSRDKDDGETNNYTKSGKGIVKSHESDPIDHPVATDAQRKHNMTSKGVYGNDEGERKPLKTFKQAVGGFGKSSYRPQDNTAGEKAIPKLKREMMENVAVSSLSVTGLMKLLKKYETDGSKADEAAMIRKELENRS